MGRSILVVDDNVRIVEILQAYLAEAGFDVRTAEDGVSALALARKSRPDLALLDVMLPGLDGIELTRTLQQEMGMPVILVTARVEEVDRLIGLEVGADDYITKPFSPREVVARVKAVLRRADRQSAAEDNGPPVTIGGLSVDLVRRAVVVDGEPVEMTRTEFDLLAAMAAHPGRVYSRAQLLGIVSGEAYEGYERTIDAHVKNLRRKLGEDSRAPRYLYTVFGVGYKVESP
ncbi:MAG: response regulator transcription factor [Actinomycetota bacterium]|nr:response regulator transcription factor [Actinomycetota bacterium]MDZ4178594.1 response regulator transcription factor [Coriobacteriia bacterium]